MSAFAPLSLHPASLPHEPMNILKARKPQKVAAVSKLLLGHIKYNCTVKRNRLTRQLQLVAPMRPSLQLNISIINPNVNACTSQQTAPMSKCMHVARNCTNVKACTLQQTAPMSKCMHIATNCTNVNACTLQETAPMSKCMLSQQTAPMSKCMHVTRNCTNVNACMLQQTAPMSMHARRKKLLFVALTGITAWPPTPQPPTPSRLHHNGCCTSCAMQRCSRAAAAAAAAAAMKAAAVLEAAVLVAAAVGKTAAYGRAHPNPQQLQHHRGSSPLRSL